MSDGLLALRPYQAEALAAVEASEFRRPAVVLPTGAGKTVVFAHLARREHERSNQPSLIIAHTDELVSQAIKRLAEHAPGLRVGRVQAASNQHAGVDAIVATVQTLRSERRRSALPSIALGIVDECHHATAASYRTVMGHFPDTRWTGFTATLARSDGAALNEVWDGVVYRKDIVDMIAMGYIVPFRGKRVRVPDLNLAGVRRSGGDYREGDLGDALTDSLAPELVAKAYVEHAAGRRGVLFAPTVASAEVFAEALSADGIVTEVVHGALPREERRAILARLRTGVTQCVANCMVLTEGFDEPSISVVVICRPTTSAGLYTQMVGRGGRLAPGKADCLVLDAVGVTGRHRLASLVDLVGDPTKILTREPDEEDLADQLVGPDGFELEDEPTRSGPSFVEGREIEVTDVDLFARSHSAWQRSPAGAWLLPAGTGTYVFLAPAGGDGRYHVASTGPNGNKIHYRLVSLETAMAWGEEVTREIGPRTLSSRNARWRADGPGVKQVGMAQSLGIAVDDFMTKGDLADKITLAMGGRTIDPWIRKWGGHAEQEQA
jgi:superfamily II DNA or RNA helicase